jgi:hypothetical protein
LFDRKIDETAGEVTITPTETNVTNNAEKKETKSFEIEKVAPPPPPTQIDVNKIRVLDIANDKSILETVLKN